MSAYIQRSEKMFRLFDIQDIALHPSQDSNVFLCLIGLAWCNWSNQEDQKAGLCTFWEYVIGLNAPGKLCRVQKSISALQNAAPLQQRLHLNVPEHIAGVQRRAGCRGPATALRCTGLRWAGLCWAMLCHAMFAYSVFHCILPQQWFLNSVMDCSVCWFLLQLLLSLNIFS